MSFGGFNFGAGNPAAAAPAPIVTAAPSNFGLGGIAAATTAPPNFGFGGTATATTSNFSFASGSTVVAAAPTTTTSNFGFGATAATGGLNFGTTAPPPTQPTANFSLTGTTQQASGGFSLGGTTVLSSTAANPLLTGTNTTQMLVTCSTAAPAFAFNTSKPIGAAAPLPAAPFTLTASTAAPATNTALSSAPGGALFSLSTPATTTTATVTASVGLGGSNTPIIGLGGGGLGGSIPPAASAGDAAGAKVEGKPSKETPLPQEIFATIAAFETFKGEEKSASEANTRLSASSFHKLGEDCNKLRVLVTQLSTLHASLQHKVNAIKEKIVTDGSDVEMARRTQSTPGHLQGDNTAPEHYFTQILAGFEGHMSACKDRIAEVERCLSVAGQLPDSEAGVRELVRRHHEGLQLAASRVYSLHAALLRLHSILPCPQPHLTPKPLFRPGLGDLSKLDDDATKSAVPKESAVVRTCFDLPGGGSRLGNFQVNVAKARAMSLNPAPPPTQPLGASLFGTGNTFNTGTNFGLQSNTSFGTAGSAVNTTAFGAGSNTTNFGGNTSTFGSGSSPYGTTFGAGKGLFSAAPVFGSSINTQAGSLFSSTFGQSNKLFKS